MAVVSQARFHCLSGYGGLLLPVIYLTKCHIGTLEWICCRTTIVAYPTFSKLLYSLKFIAQIGDSSQIWRSLVQSNPGQWFNVACNPVCIDVYTWHTVYVSGGTAACDHIRV